MTHEFIDTPQFWQQYGMGGAGHSGNGLGIVRSASSGVARGACRTADVWAIEREIAEEFGRTGLRLVAMSGVDEDLLAA